MVTSQLRMMGMLKSKSIKWSLAITLFAVVLSVVSTASATTLLEWNMNEGVGSTVGDSSGNSRDGTWNGDLVAAGSWVPGYTGLAGDSAVHFTQPVGPVPRIDWVDAGNPMPLTQNGNFEVEMQVNADGFAAEEYLFSIGQTAGTTIAIRADPSLVANVGSISKLGMTTINTGTGGFTEDVIDITGNELTTAGWQHVRLVYDETSPFVNAGTPGSSTVEFYVDGALADTVALAYALSDVTAEAHIGNIPGGIWFRTFRGDVDAFKVSSIPEPTSLALALVSVVGLAAVRRRKDA